MGGRSENEWEEVWNRIRLQTHPCDCNQPICTHDTHICQDPLVHHAAHLQPEQDEPVQYLHEEHPIPCNRCLPEVVRLFSGGSSVTPMISCWGFGLAVGERGSTAHAKIAIDAISASRREPPDISCLVTENEPVLLI
jgi:hypothetical protein